MFRTLRIFSRLLRIARVLARHDALFLLKDIKALGPLLALSAIIRKRDPHHRPGQRLAAALQALGPTFIKLGQALSTRPDLVGEEIAEDLSHLQDSLPPFPGQQARRIIEEELGASVEELFSSFDETPIAAASIAQVHFAVTTEGREVAVKVLRPGVEDHFARDIEAFYWVAELVEWSQPSFRRLKPVESVRAFEDAVQLEMDLRFEAAAAAEMGENFADDDSFNIPDVDWQRTGRRVLTLERVGGIPIDEIDRIKAAGIDPDTVLVKAAEAFFNMVFRDGFFHADLHPGNLFVDAQGNIVAVDFGITGRVDQKTRRTLGEMLLGFLTGNYRRAAEVHFEAGWVPAGKSVDAFTQACRSIAEPIMGKPVNEISIGRLLGQLFEVTRQFAMETQPQLLLLQKTMLTAEGVGRSINANVNMWQLAQPLIEQWMRANLGPEAKVRESVGQARQVLENLPRLTQQASKLFTAEGLKLHPDTIKAFEQQRRPRFPAWTPWLLVAVLAGLYLTK